MDPTPEVEQEFAGQDVERLLERMDVRSQPPARHEPDDGQVGVDRALVRAHDAQAGEAGRGVRRGSGTVHERPVDVTDGVHLEAR